MLRRGLATIKAMVRLHPRPFAIAVGGAAVFAVATVASSWALGRVTDRLIIPRFEQGDVSAGTVAAGLGLVVGIGFVKAAGIVVRRVAATITGARVGASLRTSVVRRYQEVPYSFHRTNPTGELLSHAGNDVDAAVEVLHPLPYSTGVIVIVVLSVAWMLNTDLWLALVGFVVFPVLVVANVIYQRTIEGPAESAQSQLGDVSTVAHESFDGALVVKALGAEALEGARFGRTVDGLRDAKVRVAVVRATFEALLDAIPALGILVLLPVGAWRVDQAAITIGTVVSFVSLFQLLVFPLRLFGYVLGELPRSVVSHDRIQRVLAVPIDPRHATVSQVVDPSHPRPAPGARLEVLDLGFAYEPGVTVLDRVSFTVEPGRTVAIVGATGSGKSTLLLLIAGLLDPDAGTIRLDGRDQADLSVDELRSQVATAFQEAFLFAETVTENVLLGAPDDGLDDALRLAGAERFVGALDDGVHSIVGERGATLSGGQRQRLALARALVRRPRLLLLDDATSAVDPTTEGRILAALSDELGGTTTMVVASRPATIALADEVLFLEAGRLVDHGTHAELVRRQPGYQRMVQAYELDRADRDGDVVVGR
ncbi:MAG: ABC transporter ATP-binding protein [Acidimicrobiia bacterium]|nr:ABC transporter ATP-binding protein [Acidimicrobiia bacterium]